MTFFERIFGEETFSEIWRQMRTYVFKQNRWRQLLTLKPIEIYNTDTEVILDETKVQLHIEAYIENLVQRRIERTKDLLSFNFLDWQRNALHYSFQVVIHAQTDYNEIARFFNLHFAGKSYALRENRYSIFLRNFSAAAEGTKARVLLPFSIDARWGFFKRRLHGTAIFKGSLTYNNPPFTIRTRNLNYELQTNSWLLKIADNWYHTDILKFLSGFLEYNFSEEIFHARVHAQEQLNEFQQENEWVHGTLNELKLDRIIIEPDALRAVFLANGKLHPVR